MVLFKILSVPVGFLELQIEFNVVSIGTAGLDGNVADDGTTIPELELLCFGGELEVQRGGGGVAIEGERLA